MAGLTDAENCARAIVPLVGAELGITFVAIAGCESSFGTNNYTNHGYTGYGTCHGARSFGAWQINMQAHGSYLQSATGSPDACTWANWLLNLTNNAHAAVAVYHAAGGFGPWSTFTDGCYKQNLSVATQAVANVGKTSPPSTSTPSTSSPLPFLPSGPDWVPIIVIGAAGLMVVVLLEKAGAHDSRIQEV